MADTDIPPASTDMKEDTPAEPAVDSPVAEAEAEEAELSLLPVVDEAETTKPPADPKEEIERFAPKTRCAMASMTQVLFWAHFAGESTCLRARVGWCALNSCARYL